MCGIAGVLDLRRREPVTPEVLQSMTDALSHRGPDSEGQYISENLGLGHRRLAIIDPTPAGHQPMVSSDGRVAVCYNGTIYNYWELRPELEELGHQFKSNCDTEILIHAWEEWGEAMVPRFNGHFAFLVWDDSAKTLTLARDRFGTKPLYWTNQGGLWLFASEVRAILAHPAYTPDINYDALCEYFTFQNLFRYRTLFKGINLLAQANVLTIDARTGEVKRHSFWDYDFTKPDETMDACEAKQETCRLMEQAVSRQLFADVPLGAYLSGGMDSGSIVAIASQEEPCLHTFTCGWHMGGVDGLESQFDERAAAEMMAYLFNTQHYMQVVGHSDVVWAMQDLVSHVEDLRLGMCYGNYYIARLASKFVKVCLSGTGGDELFGGYPWRYYHVSRSLNRDEYFDRYYEYWQRLVPDEDRARFFTADAYKRITDTDMKRVLSRVFTFNDSLKYDTPEDHIANSLYFEAKTFLHGLLVLGDRLAMAHGLEERFPFLDNDLCDFAMKIPVRHKLRNLGEWKKQDENVWGKKRHFQSAHDDGKNVLRRAMERFIPEEVRKRRKQGFSSPDESWYRGPNLEYVQNMIMGKKALCHEFISPEFIRRTMDEHCARKANHRLLIWSILCFENWLEIFMEGRKDGLNQPSAFGLPVGAVPQDRTIGMFGGS